MLHKRELSQPEVDDLEIVFAVKVRLLCWLLRTPPVGLVAKQELLNEFGPLVGVWLWRKIRQVATRTTFGKAVDTLATKARGTALVAQQVADAIEHDRQFDVQWGTPGFAMQFPRLYPDWLEPVEAVASRFYDWLAATGFDSVVFSLAGGNISRARIMDAFWAEHPKVCGYCDGPLGEKSESAEANDCEHFLPRSKFPHLAIHPRNLFSACLGCNRTWKGANAPMGDGDANGLAETYHPNFRPGASSITVTADTSPNNPRQVELTLSDATVPMRAITLNETLKLKSRWTTDVNKSIEGEGVSVFVAESIRTARQGHALSVDELNKIIDASIAWCRYKRGKRERMMRQEAVLCYQKSHLLAEMLRELQ